MKTVTVMIGNGNDKLTQKEWSEYVEAVRASLNNITSRVHFDGCTPADHPTQRACFVVEVDDVAGVKDVVIEIKLAYGLTTAALTVGDTEFI